MGVWVCGCVGVWVETIVFTVPPDGTARQVASHSYKPPPPLPADAASSLPHDDRGSSLDAADSGSRGGGSRLSQARALNSTRKALHASNRRVASLERNISLLQEKLKRAEHGAKTAEKRAQQRARKTIRRALNDGRDNHEAGGGGRRPGSRSRSPRREDRTQHTWYQAVDHHGDDRLESEPQRRGSVDAHSPPRPPTPTTGGLALAPTPLPPPMPPPKPAAYPEAVHRTPVSQAEANAHPLPAGAPSFVFTPAPSEAKHDAQPRRQAVRARRTPGSTHTALSAWQRATPQPSPQFSVPTPVSAAGGPLTAQAPPALATKPAVEARRRTPDTVGEQLRALPSPQFAGTGFAGEQARQPGHDGSGRASHTQDGGVGAHHGASKPRRRGLSDSSRGRATSPVAAVARGAGPATRKDGPVPGVGATFTRTTPAVVGTALRRASSPQHVELDAPLRQRHRGDSTGRSASPPTPPPSLQPGSEPKSPSSGAPRGGAEAPGANHAHSGRGVTVSTPWGKRAVFRGPSLGAAAARHREGSDHPDAQPACGSTPPRSHGSKQQDVKPMTPANLARLRSFGFGHRPQAYNPDGGVALQAMMFSAGVGVGVDGDDSASDGD